MTLSRPIPGWTPSTPEVLGPAIGDVTRQHPVIAIHFWAPWNGSDPLMDRSIRAIERGFDQRVYFASCNTELEVNGELLRRCGIVNIPALSVIVSGVPRRAIGGCREPEGLANEIESRLREPASKPWWASWRGRHV